MAEAGWSWSDYSGMATVGVFLATVGGWFHKGLSEKATMAAAKADDAMTKAEKASADLSAYKAEAIEKFVPRAHLDQIKSEIIQRIDKQDDASRSSFGQVTDRLDRIIEDRAKHDRTNHAD